MKRHEHMHEKDERSCEQLRRSNVLLGWIQLSGHKNLEWLYMKVQPPKTLAISATSWLILLLAIQDSLHSKPLNICS